MWLADQWRDFSLLDAGHGMKLEQWGHPPICCPARNRRPCGPRKAPPAAWEAAHAVYHRSHAGGGQWEYKEPLPDQWEITYANKLRFIVRPTGFKRPRAFPGAGGQLEVAWAERFRAAGGRVRVLNLFAYTGGATLACAAARAGGGACRRCPKALCSGLRKTRPKVGSRKRPSPAISWMTV